MTIKLLNNYERARMRAAIAILDIDQSAIAQKFGVSSMAISRLLGGKGGFSEKNAPDLVEYLRMLIPSSEVTLKRLFENSNEEIFESVNENEAQLELQGIQ